MLEFIPKLYVSMFRVHIKQHYLKNKFCYAFKALKFLMGFWTFQCSFYSTVYLDKKDDIQQLYQLFE
jgi:hypothetical protein